MVQSSIVRAIVATSETNRLVSQENANGGETDWILSSCLVAERYENFCVVTGDIGLLSLVPASDELQMPKSPVK